MRMTQLPVAGSLDNTDMHPVNKNGVSVQISTLNLVKALRKDVYGAPLVASSMSEMTDTARVYVYIGNELGYNKGHWFYYDGNKWEDGGVYNSAGAQTDTTFTLPGVAADAKETGDSIATTRKLIAPIEATNVSANAYSVGAHFVYNGSLCVASAEINVGDEISFATNCIRATVGAELRDLADALNMVSKSQANVMQYNLFGGTTFEQGGFSNGAFDRTRNRIRAKEAIDFSAFIGRAMTIILPEQFMWNGINADASGNPVGLWSGKWWESGASFTPNADSPYFYLMIRRADNSNFSAGSMPYPPIMLADVPFVTAEGVQRITASNDENVYGITWENKGYSNGRYVDDPNRLMSDEMRYTVGTKLTVDTDGDYYINVYQFDSNGELKLFDRQWNADYPKAYQVLWPVVRLLVRRVDNTAIRIGEGAHIAISSEKVSAHHACGKFDGKRISILGDSLSTFGGDPSAEPRYSDGEYTYPGNRCRYPQSNLLMDVHQTYWMMLIDEFNMTMGVNDSWAGSRVTWDGSSEGADIGANKYIASPTRIGHLGENGTPDIILVNAGTNDIGANNVQPGVFDTSSPAGLTPEQIAALPVETFADAYRTLLIRLQYAYPNAQIVVLLPNYAGYTAARQDAFCEIIKEACDFFGVVWCDMRTSTINVVNRRTYLPDGTHYNGAGMIKAYMNVANTFLYDLI